MSALSTHARFVLDRMEDDRLYELPDLRIFMPDAGAEQLRELMHELWIGRHVERVGHTGWRRHRSSTGQESAPKVRPARLVKPEELFDHDTFEDFFR